MSTQSTSSRQLDFKAVQNIIAKRKTIKVSDAKALVNCYIQSNGGTTIPVTTKDGEPVLGANGTPLMKTIYNVAANSHVAMLNPRNREILAAAIKAESDADMVEATKLFNQYLNSIQVSFNVLLTGTDPVTFAKDELVKGTVALITTENGQLITLEKVSAVKARELSDTPKFTLNDLLGITENGDGKTAEETFKAVDPATENEKVS